VDRTLYPSIALLLIVFGVSQATGIDLWLQDHFYNFATHRWLVDSEAPLPRLVFYTGAKKLIKYAGFLLLAAALFYRQLPFLKFPRRGLWVAVLTLATAPAIIGFGKNTTNTCTPSAIRRYGGDLPYVKVIECYPDNDRPADRERAFPAGHASGGFSLLALVGLATTARGRALGLATGLTLGTVMGGYQMLRGAHYLVDTLVTAITCWIVFLTWRRILSGPKFYG
jgi:membrane-associated PAP2 superfamily phosphatase